MRYKNILILALGILSFTHSSLAQENSLIYQDPKESSFVIAVPEGFGVKGQMIRPYQEPVIWLQIEKHKDLNTIFYISNPSVPLFVEPNDTLLKKGILEGSKYKISNQEEQFFVVKYMKATDYIKNLFLPQLKVLYKDLELSELEDKTNLIKKNINLELLMISPEFSAGEGVFKFSSKKKKIISKIFVVTQKLLPRSDGFSIWYAKVLTFHCPVEDFEKNNIIFNKIIESFYLSSNWLRDEAVRIFPKLTDKKLREDFIQEKYRIFFKDMPA